MSTVFGPHVDLSQDFAKLLQGRRAGDAFLGAVEPTPAGDTGISTAIWPSSRCVVNRRPLDPDAREGS